MSKTDAIRLRQTTWTGSKKVLEDQLLLDDNTVKVRKWIKKDEDPEPGLDTIKRRVMPNGQYGDAAQWFLNRPEFESWSNKFLRPGRATNHKRVLWIWGTYGTGKTTLLYHSYSALVDDTGFGLNSGNIQVIPYFCDANKAGSERPNSETIVRALIWHLALLPDHTLAEVARNQ